MIFTLPLIASMALLLGNHASATPISPDAVRREAQSPALHCGSVSLDSTQIDNAYWNLHYLQADGNDRVWLNGKSSAFGYDGQAQFYMCNNAASERYFTLDQNQMDLVNKYYNQCGNMAFWVMNDDHWSYGVDTKGNAECGGF